MEKEEQRVERLRAAQQRMSAPEEMKNVMVSGFGQTLAAAGNNGATEGPPSSRPTPPAPPGMHGGGIGAANSAPAALDRGGDPSCKRSMWEDEDDDDLSSNIAALTNRFLEDDDLLKGMASLKSPSARGPATPSAGDSMGFFRNKLEAIRQQVDSDGSSSEESDFDSD